MPMEGGIGPCLSAKYTQIRTFSRCPAWHTEHNHCAADPPVHWRRRRLTGYFEPANLLLRRILVP